MTHVAYHRGAMAHSFPGYKPSDRNHGAVSEYEPLNIPQKLHTEFEADAEIPDDYLPLVPAPYPSLTSGAFDTDPTLMITPDKLGQKCPDNVPPRSQHVQAPSLPTPDPRLCLTPKSKDGSKNKVPSLPTPDPRLCLTPDQPKTLSRLAPVLVHTASEVIPSRPTLMDPDPSLAITPEKPPLSSKAKSNLKTDNSENIKHKQKQRVRFDIQSSLVSETKSTDISENLNQEKSPKRVYQPKMYVADTEADDMFFTECDQNLNDTEDNILTIKSVAEPNENLEDVTVTSKSKPKRSSVSAKEKENERGDSVIPQTNNHVPKRKVVVTREFQERPVLTEYQYPFDAADPPSDSEHIFSRPEFHNSLKMYSEIKVLDGMVPDVCSAVNKHLKDSEETRTEISEKASCKVNQKFSSSVYRGLVGVEAPIDDLRQKTEANLALKTKPVRLSTKSRDREPDLMEFFGPHLMKECPDLSLSDVSAPSDSLMTAPHSLAFDLYRHNRVWEGH